MRVLATVEDVARVYGELVGGEAVPGLLVATPPGCQVYGEQLQQLVEAQDEKYLKGERGSAVSIDCIPQELRGRDFSVIYLRDSRCVAIFADVNGAHDDLTCEAVKEILAHNGVVSEIDIGNTLSLYVALADVAKARSLMLKFGFGSELVDPVLGPPPRNSATICR